MALGLKTATGHPATLVIGALLGYMLASKIDRVPLVNKLPKF